jgi:DNA-binding protein H-NS
VTDTNTAAVAEVIADDTNKLTNIATQLADLDAERERLRLAAEDVVARMRQRLESLGFKLTPIKPAKAARPQRVRGVPKYRNPTTGKTWTGKGRQPKWIAEALATGASLNSFLIG